LHISCINTDGVFEDKVVNKSTPFDTTITLYHGYAKEGIYYIGGEAFDKMNNSIRTGDRNINVSKVGGIWETLFPFPNSRVYLFATLDPNDEYNKLKTQSERNAFLENIRANDITPTIPTGVHTVGGKDYGFACAQASRLFSTNCIDLGKNPYIYNGKENGQDVYIKMYNWYNDGNFDSIYVNRGTLKYAGNHRAPVFTAQVSPTHQMNYAVTGNDLREGNKSIDLIETMYRISKSNVQFDGMLYPLNYDDFMFYYTYKYIDDGRNCQGNIPIVKYKLENGVLKFEGTNPNVEVALTRDAK
jgi:hypothetical protein